MALVIGILAASYVLVRGTTVYGASDLDQVLMGAKALLHGRDPYQVVGPYREFAWDYLYYPVPAMLVVTPIALLPLLTARAIFAFVSATALAAGLIQHRKVALMMFLSAPTMVALARGQWSPLLAATAFFPFFSWMGIAKPHIALALLPGTRNIRRAIVSGALGAVVLVVSSFLITPGWLDAWLEELAHKADATPIVLKPGGFLILLALTRWRRAETWILLTLGCVPQTPSIYDMVPLFLIARGFRETALLVIGGNVAWLLVVSGMGQPTDELYARYNEHILLTNVLFLYAPCTWFILRRPNESRDPTPEVPLRASSGLDRALVLLVITTAFFALWSTIVKYLA